MKALVVGGAGFVGSYLVKTLLERGNEVRVLDSSKRFLEETVHPKLEFVLGSILDEKTVNEAVTGVDVIYHLAIIREKPDKALLKRALKLFEKTLVRPDPSKQLLEEFCSNIAGTAFLLEASKNHNIKHFIFTSSVAVYGLQKDVDLNEESCCHPENLRLGGMLYGTTKLAAERYCLFYHYQQGLPVTILRFHTIYRPDKLIQNHIEENIQKALEGKPMWVTKNMGGQYIYIEDAVDAYLLATLNKKAYGQIFNIGGPYKFDDYEIAQYIVEKTNSKSQIEVKSSPIFGLVSVDTRKAKRILGFNPTRGKEFFEKIVADYIDSLKKH
ncbi:NAD(P)-dependent oxidoreductase [Candidatus Bathyarchaeota archaeon]|nr:NAD(P)-dependent oxidoreductase [Candidatus Bathyarchaeota archaeon]